MTFKQNARKTKEFAQAHGYEIAYATYCVAAFAFGYWVTKKSIQAYNANVMQAVEHETLRMAVAAGHEFTYDPQANLLWDVTIRPDMKAG